MSWLRAPLGKFTWRMLATVLFGQGLSVLLGATLARSVAATTGEGDPGGQLWAGLALGLLCFAAAGGMRRGWGLPLGWVAQALTLASALIVPLMLWVGLMFLALWIYCLRKGPQIDAAVAARDAEAATPSA
ncbi:DUF4233 domain-containing protein [Nostocoides australiense]|uniref:DUF4233 domain-containing protein n=1 Tax=Nostocoides australiense Ben110 TaxID=1193182 RepID=W6K213_9MICO|nr:DUF4233 domain-containing protein [Tetrasphaera australiensis]MCB1299919.1 DUF4233 domain-containing protein [Tetrasphaera sp.]CCH72359.1 conserved inner membrane hypothetical protein [Tetrasphaera australiensis Ben110]